VLRPGGRTHIKHQILQTCRLCRRPVDTRSGIPTWNSGHIEDKVAYLSIKNVGGTPVQVRRVVRVAVNQTKSGETGGSFERGDVGWVTKQYGEVLVNDGRRNQVGSCGEVDYGGSGSAGCAAFAAAATSKDGIVDSCSVIRDTIT
jgi:predicted RecA/RadA family phage recombinase